MATVGNLFAVSAFTFGTGKTWAETATVTTAAQTVSVPGLLVGDIVTVVKPTEQAGLGVCGTRVSAADTLTIIFNNPTAAGITATAEEEWTGLLFRPESPLTSTLIA
jgi:hypothetical protein